MLSKYLTNILHKDEIISEDEKEIVQFGLESIEGNLLSIVLTLAVGSCFQRFYDAMLLWVLLFLLRKNAGGFHASTKLRCCIVSIVQLAISFLIFSVFFCTSIFYGICVTVAGCIIWILAPIGNLSKELDIVEYKVYRKRCRLVLLLEELFFVISLYYKWDMGMSCTSMALFIVSISLLLAVRGKKYSRIIYESPN